MLGTPPAFVLSQDQTLKFKSSTALSHSFALFISLRPLSRTGIAWLVFASLDLSVKQPQFFFLYTVFKVLAAPPPPGNRDSLFSISPFFLFVNMLFQLF